MAPIKPSFLPWGLGNRGTTLVEMMVSCALFGVLSLGMADMFADNSRKMARAQNESRLSEQVSEFSQAMENMMGNTTQLISCGCAGGCIFNEAVTSGAVPMPGDCMGIGSPCGLQTAGNPGLVQGTTVLRFEYEDANDPTSTPANNALCVAGTLGNARVAAGTTPETMTLRGCKKVMRINFVEPAADTPGQLLMFAENPTTRLVPVAGPGSLPIHSLIGVYQFRCGQLAGPAGKPFSDHFKLELKMKARSNNLTLSSASNYFEGWSPGSANFTSGTHRNLDFDINFHNFNVPGVQFGKTITSPECTLTGGNSPIGDCCTGYMDNLGNCLDTTACKVKGATPAGGALGFAACCSHKMLGGKCV